MSPATSANRPVRFIALLLGLTLLCVACSSGPSREEIRAYLDSTYRDDPERDATWLSTQPVAATADTIAQQIEPRDVFTEGQATFMRDGDYIVAVFPESAGSRIEFDDYDRMRNRYLPIIVPFWGANPRSYGPRGDVGGGGGAGGFRGGGPGSGK